MKILRAKIKKDTPFYQKGLNQKGKSIWLEIIDFRTKGDKNFKVKAFETIKNGFAVYEEIWLSANEVTLKQFEDDQLQLDLVSQEEFEELMRSPRYSNKRRYEVVTDNEKQFIYALDLTEAQKFARQLGLANAKVKQVQRLKKHDL